MKRIYGGINMENKEKHKELKKTMRKKIEKELL